MKMLPKKKGRNEGWRNIKLTGMDGDTVTFATIKAAAKFLEVTKQTIYISLKYGWKVRGCLIEAERA